MEASILIVLADRCLSLFAGRSWHKVRVRGSEKQRSQADKEEEATNWLNRGQRRSNSSSSNRVGADYLEENGATNKRQEGRREVLWQFLKRVWNEKYF